MNDKGTIYGQQIPLNKGYVTSTPGSVEDFSARINASVESARNPQSETSLLGFVGAVVRVAKEGIKQSDVRKLND